MKRILLLLGVLLFGCGEPYTPTGPWVERCHTTIHEEIYFYPCGEDPPTELDIPEYEAK